MSENFIVVLHQPQEPRNIGAVVRAMLNMGFSRLRLVQPVPFPREALLALAHRSDDLIDRIETYDDLDAALADTQLVVGTAAGRHPGIPFTGDVRSLAVHLHAEAVRARIALLFGPEADGLDRAALDRCHLIASLPSDPIYPALNLAQAVLLLLYELRMAAAPPPPAVPLPPAAPQAEMERLFLLAEEALDAVDFFKYGRPQALSSLRRIAYRARLQPQEAALLMAIARRVLDHARSTR